MCECASVRVCGCRYRTLPSGGAAGARLLPGQLAQVPGPLLPRPAIREGLFDFKRPHVFSFVRELFMFGENARESLTLTTSAWIFAPASCRAWLSRSVHTNRPRSGGVSSHESATFRVGGRVARLATRQRLLHIPSPTLLLHHRRGLSVLKRPNVSLSCVREL